MVNKISIFLGVVVVLILLVVGGIFLFLKPGNTSKTPTPIISKTSGTPFADNPDPTPQTTPMGGEKEVTFNIEAKQFEFSPSTIRVSFGDKVILNVKSTDVEHGFYLPDYNINEDLLPGQQATIKFTADKKGTFKFKCNVPCGAGHQEMTGTLIVV